MPILFISEMIIKNTQASFKITESLTVPYIWESFSWRKASRSPRISVWSSLYYIY